MTYREPAPRPPRLFYVVCVYANEDGQVRFVHTWEWAREEMEALDAVLRHSGANRGQMRAFDVICGEDFADREAAGPPKEPK